MLSLCEAWLITMGGKTDRMNEVGGLDYVSVFLSPDTAGLKLDPRREKKSLVMNSMVSGDTRLSFPDEETHPGCKGEVMRAPMPER